MNVSKRSLIALSFATIALLFSACTKPAGSEYIGKWGDRGFSLLISQDGDHLLVKYLNAAGEVVEWRSAAVVNDVLEIDGGSLGPIRYSPSENELLVAGGYLKRVN